MLRWCVRQVGGSLFGESCWLLICGFVIEKLENVDSRIGPNGLNGSLGRTVDKPRGKQRSIASQLIVPFQGFPSEALNITDFKEN